MQHPIPDPADSLSLPVPGHRIGRDGTVWKYLAGPAKDRGRGARWKALKPSIRERHLWIMLGPKGQRKSYRVAALVLSAFVGPRPIASEPYHFPDGDPRNCRADNLRWVPRGTNGAERCAGAKNLPKRPAGAAHHNARLTPRQVRAARNLYRQGWGMAAIADRLGCHAGTVLNLLRGRTYRDVPDPLGPVVLRPRGARPGDFNPASKSGPEEQAEMRRKLAAGVPAKVVAAEHGYHLGRVYQIRRKMM